MSAAEYAYRRHGITTRRVAYVLQAMADPDAVRQAQRDYVAGMIDVDELERRLDHAMGRAPAPPQNHYQTFKEER
jgi:hypothetical protein